MVLDLRSVGQRMNMDGYGWILTLWRIISFVYTTAEMDLIPRYINQMFLLYTSCDSFLFAQQ